jgi:hypothetical protein
MNLIAAPSRRRPCRPTPGALGVAAAVALLAAACGGSPASAGSGAPASAGGSSSPPSAVAYSACMRAHGVPRFPDPDSGGQLPKADAHRLGVGGSQLGAAQRACRPMLPNTGAAIDAGSIQQCMLAADCPAALVQQVLSEERSFARCMRSHGVPNWPDPSVDSQGRPVFAISIAKLGFDPYSRQIWAKGNGCAHLMPGLPGLPAAVSP